MLVCVITIEAKDGQIAAVVESCERLERCRLLRNGCRSHRRCVDASLDMLLVEPARPNVITIFEEWESAAAVAAVGVSDERTSFMTSISPLVDSVSVRFFEAHAEY